MTERQIFEDYVDKGLVRFVFRHFPVLGEESVMTAEAAECAAEQGKFWEYHNAVFNFAPIAQIGGYSNGNLKGYALQIGLDREQFDTCFDERRFRSRIDTAVSQGRALGVRSTPTIFINDQRLDGLRDYREYRQVIESELAKNHE